MTIHRYLRFLSVASCLLSNIINGVRIVNQMYLNCTVVQFLLPAIHGKIFKYLFFMDSLWFFCVFNAYMYMQFIVVSSSYFNYCIKQSKISVTSHLHTIHSICPGTIFFLWWNDGHLYGLGVTLQASCRFLVIWCIWARI